MDLERLTKSQIILLTLFVSFITSIATGIVTVSLMDQAPPVIAQTVNRVIEHTVQQAIPAQAAAVAVPQEKTVVVKEADLIAKAVEAASPSVVKLYTQNRETNQYLGAGIVVGASGIIVTDSTVPWNDGALVVRSDGIEVGASVLSKSDKTGLAYLKASATTTADGKPLVWTPIAFASGHAVLGQTVAMLYGKTVSRLMTGIVTAMLPDPADETRQYIDTNLPADSVVPGAPIIDSAGALVGVSTSVSRASSPSGFVPSAMIEAPKAE